jgi:hypothetical protein
MDKVCLINQPVGLGDIIFCQKIGQYYYDKGYEIIWPVSDVYLEDVKYYIDSPFKFIKTGSQLPKSDVCLKLDGSKLPDKMIMESKYIVANVPYRGDWINYFNVNRNYEKEHSLFKELGLSDGEKYVLYNFNYASPPNSVRMSTDFKNNDIKQIELKFIKGYSLFDWIKVIENAYEICTTDCALTFLIEKFKTNKTKQLTMISRRPTFDEIEYMYSLDWDYVVGKRI